MWDRVSGGNWMRFIWKIKDGSADLIIVPRRDVYPLELIDAVQGRGQAAVFFSRPQISAVSPILIDIYHYLTGRSGRGTTAPLNKESLATIVRRRIEEAFLNKELLVFRVRNKYLSQVPEVAAQNQPSAPPPQNARRSPSDESFWVHFKYLVKGTQHPVQDDRPWTLHYPTGEIEVGRLNKGGEVWRDGVPAGDYRLRVQHLTGINWGAAATHGEEKVALRVTGENIPDGERAEIKIFPQYASREAPPRETLAVTFRANQAPAAWTFRQGLHQPPFGDFIAVARWGEKTATSGVLAVEAHAVENNLGLQQRLKHLGYYDGGLDGIVGAKTTAASRRFQEQHPPLIVDGLPGPRTRELLRALTY